jgi:hypothetical protein
MRQVPLEVRFTHSVEAAGRSQGERSFGKKEKKLLCVIQGPLLLSSGPFWNHPSPLADCPSFQS